MNTTTIKTIKLNNKTINMDERMNNYQQAKIFMAYAIKDSNRRIKEDTTSMNACIERKDIEGAQRFAHQIERETLIKETITKYFKDAMATITHDVPKEAWEAIKNDDCEAFCTAMTKCVLCQMKKTEWTRVYEKLNGIRSASNSRVLKGQHIQKVVSNYDKLGSTFCDYLLQAAINSGLIKAMTEKNSEASLKACLVELRSTLEASMTTEAIATTEAE